MSENLTQLSRRHGLEDNLFEHLKHARNDEERRALSRRFLLGEANVLAARSFYDFTQGDNAHKKAYVCNGSSCLCAGTQERVGDILRAHVGAEQVGQVTCLGRCHENAAFQIEGQNFSGRDIERLGQSAKMHSSEAYTVRSTLENPVLLQTTGATADYYALWQRLIQQSRDAILAEIISADLRGRGGAGFPAGIKWRAVKEQVAEEKYIVCNADEGDPGAYSDRYLLEYRPHAILFGMLVAGWITGARQGVIYIRDEYPASVTACEKAVGEFSALDFDHKPGFKFKIIRGAGAYICGEETALLRSIEGQRPMVSTRPPFPAQKGLFGQPTLVNNAETFATLHWLLEFGAPSFKTLGTAKSSGSKLLSLDASFNQPGIVEVAMGTPLSTVVDELGGGFSRPTKALHIGGPLGGLLPIAKIADLTIDFESFAEQGLLLGHAGIIGIPESMPMIVYLQHLFEFTAVESCGKCFPCRLGARRGQEMMAQAIAGSYKIERELLDDVLQTMAQGSLCALGGGVPLPVKNALKYFAQELEPFFATEADHA